LRVLWPGWLVSLLEIMERFYPEAFVMVAGLLGAVRQAPDETPGLFGAPFVDLSVSDENRRRLSAAFFTLGQDCATHGLLAAATSAQRLSDLFSKPRPDPQRLKVLADEFHGRLGDEMASVMFLSLTLQEAKLYRDPRSEWAEILDLSRFPGAIRDVEDAGRCLALGRNTACVFHLMRIMELGLRSLGKALKDPSLDPRTNPAWEKILRKCDDELKKPLASRSPEWASDEQFFSEATAFLRAVKDAWRNPTMHIEKHYDATEAADIWRSVRAFMRHLATKLTE
jgi:hypothetical protein